MPQIPLITKIIPCHLENSKQTLSDNAILSSSDSGTRSHTDIKIDSSTNDNIINNVNNNNDGFE